MDFWNEMEKTMHEDLPKCYSFILEDSKMLVREALKSSKEEHAERIRICKGRVNHYQYATGGEVLHRGYYCPSLIKDIVIGNCNRGRTVRNPTKTKQKITYEYAFQDNHLLLVKHNTCDHSDEIEYVTYSDKKQIGYTFDNEMQLRTISECIYQDENLTSYFIVNLDFDGTFISSEKEIYEYDNGLLHSVTVYMMQTTNSCTHDKYIFSHDQDGFLTTYQVIEYENGTVKENSYWKDHWFKVHKRRKV